MTTELTVIKLAKEYVKNPDRENEVFEKVAIGFLQPLIQAGKAGLQAAKGHLATQAGRLATPAGRQAMMQGAKNLPGRTWQGYKRLWNQDPLGTGVNTLMLGSMIKGSSEKNATINFLQARQSLKENMINYHLADTQDKAFYKKAALEALKIMGQ